MSTEENESLVRRYVEQILNRGNMAVADELLAADYRRHISPTTAPLSVDVQKQRLAGIRTAFPDWHLTVEDMIADGDRVAFRATIRGTHKGHISKHRRNRQTGDGFRHGALATNQAFCLCSAACPSQLRAESDLRPGN